jgi:dTDP-4-dehydrorhamnose 3,5-epimerase
MLIETTEIPEVKLIKPKKFTDNRGHFVETFNKKFLNLAGIEFNPAQENQSFSTTNGTIRGLHFQRAPYVQAKLVRVLRGRIIDVAVDIRERSPTYRQWVSAELSAADGEMLFIPGGFAHGFCTLEDNTEVAYLVDNHYSAESDGCILWNDATLGIKWPDHAGAAISDKDRHAQKLEDISPPFPG